MAATALIKLTQGATTDIAGRAVEGVASSAVVASNGSNTDVTSWAWYLVDAPDGTALTIDEVDSDLNPTGSPAATTSTFTFTPDVAGTYQVLLIVNGIRALFDVRDFVVAEASGDRIPAQRSDERTYNLGGDSHALRRDVNAILRKAAAGGGSSSLTVVRNTTTGTVAAAASTRIYHKATGAVTYQLPASPTDGDVIEIERRAVGTGSISIDGNGHNVDVGTGAGASYGPSATLLFASLQYDATDGVWSA